ncbi:MAG: DNA polymerase III subunit gamma/tau [Candidatus Portnoybacteria bacterium]|nr:DNA polymerase III subunit gamma/tau [Candidatus Portnoybacteria bacterium]
MSHLVIYRKYRPQRFSEVSGQEHVIQTLTNALKEGKIAHAYLFAGPRGTGKTTIARLLAKAINCTGDNNIEPCNKCLSCTEISNNRAIDLIEIDAASNRGIDEIREIRERARFTPTQSKYKVFVIDEAHQLTKEAFNALLKTLEEPPAHAIFILATTEPHKMLPTILSRVQRFDFRKLSLPDIIKKLKTVAKKEKIDIEEKALRVIALNAEGYMRDAESMLGQVIAFSTTKDKKKITIENVKEILGIVDINLAIKFIDLLAEKKTKEAILFIDKFVSQGYDLVQFVQSLINYSRKLLLISINKDLSKLIKEELSSEQLNTAKKQSEKFSSQQISQIIEILINCLYKIKRSSFPQIELELAIVDINEK